MSMPNVRVIRNGKIGVIISPGYGAGWYTWSKNNNQQMLFDSGLIDLIEKNASYDSLRSYCESVFPDEYFPGSFNVVWVPIGTKFIVDEYDGSESIQLIENFNWIEA
jgi:hypothetical protein